jgi:RNAse (barnase) inhibitor barstar
MSILERLKSGSGGLVKGSLSLAEQLELGALGFVVLHLDRAAVFNKETLLHAFYQAAKFPAYFGFNWDALADLLMDFHWLPKHNGVVLILQNTTLLEPDVLSTLLEITEEVTLKRASKKLVPLFLVMP